MLSFLYYPAVSRIHCWLLKAFIVLGIGIPTDYVQVQKVFAKLVFRCVNSEGKIFYTPENRHGTSKCTHEKAKASTNHHFLDWRLVFGRINVLFPWLSSCLFGTILLLPSGLWKVLPVDLRDPMKRFFGWTFDCQQSYCWWLKSCSHQLRLVVYPIIYEVLYGFIKMVLYIPGGARFQPSTVAQLFFEDEYVYHSCFQYDFWVEVDGMDAIVKGTLVKGPYKLI